MGHEWRDCIVTMIDMVGVKNRAQDGHASKLMRRFHALIGEEIGTLPSVAHAYAWNDSVLLLSYLTDGDTSYQSAVRDAEKLKRRIDRLAISYAIAVKGQAFPPKRDEQDPTKSKITVIETSGWAMANCFEIEKALAKKWRKPWYVDIRIASKIQTRQTFHVDTVNLLPTGRARRVHMFDDYIWDAPTARRHDPRSSGSDINDGPHQ